MKISWVTPSDERFASYRYRMLIPGEVLEDMGHDVSIGEYPEPYSDVVVFSKHYLNDPEIARECRHMGMKVVFDVCDDHLDGPLGEHYRNMIVLADQVTAATPAMAERIKEVTGRDSIVVDDPYEYPEREPTLRKPGKTMWFGHPTNFPSLDGYEFDEIVSAPILEGITPWSPENMDAALSRCDVVVIPHSQDRKNLVKSPNRVIESIRSGKFVCASRIPSYVQFTGMAYIGDPHLGIEFYREEKEETVRAMILAGQEYVRKRFSPEVIASQWLSALT